MRLINHAPDAKENMSIIELNKILQSLKSVTLALQRENCDMVTVPLIFDAVISKFPDIDGEKYLTTHADIVHSKHFENGIWKIQSGKEKDLKVQEKIACKDLRVVRNAVVHVVEHEAELDFASEVLS